VTSLSSIQFERDAQIWDEAGRPPEWDKSQRYTMALYCWIGSKGARHDGVSQHLAAYCEALREQFRRKDPEWYDNLLNERDACDRCGETYRLENVSICTYCRTTFAPCHMPEDYLPNGNRECPSCGEGGIVG
jgi:ribosomal protein S27AE